MISITLTDAEAIGYINGQESQSPPAGDANLEAKLLEYEATIKAKDALLEIDAEVIIGLRAKITANALYATQRSKQDEIERPKSSFPQKVLKLTLPEKPKRKVFKLTLANMDMIEAHIGKFSPAASAQLYVLHGKLPVNAISLKNFRQRLARLGIRFSDHKQWIDLPHWDDKELFNKAKTKLQKANK